MENFHRHASIPGIQNFHPYFSGWKFKVPELKKMPEFLIPVFIILQF